MGNEDYSIPKQTAGSDCFDFVLLRFLGCRIGKHNAQVPLTLLKGQMFLSLSEQEENLPPTPTSRCIFLGK